MESRFCPKINESVLLRYFTKQLTDREAECVEEWIQASEKALRQVKRKMLRKRSWLFVKTRFQQTAAILLIILLKFPTQINR